MPLLAAWLGSAIAAVVSFFATWLTKAIAIRVAVIAALVALTLAMVAALEGMLSAVAAVMPAEVSNGLSWFWPSNGTACVAVCVAAHVTRWVYDMNVKALTIKAGV